MTKHWYEQNVQSKRTRMQYMENKADIIIAVKTSAQLACVGRAGARERQPRNFGNHFSKLTK